MKKCNCCKEFKPISDFGNLHCTKDGLTRQCKSCGNTKTKYYRDKFRDIYNENQQKVRMTKEGAIAQILSSAKSRSKQKGLEIDITAEFLLELLEKTNMICQVSGQQMSFGNKSYKDRNMTKVSLDRIDSHKGYTKDNVQLVCWAVNLMKNSMDEEEFKFWINTIHKAISSQA